MPEDELKLSKKQLFSIIFGPENKSIFWFTFRRQRRVTHSCSSLPQSDLTIKKSRPKNHGCKKKFCANKKMLARQSRYVSPCTCGNKSSKRCHARALPTHQYRRRNFLQKWPPVRPPGPRRARPCWPPRGPRIGHPPRSKIGPRRTRKLKIREQFSVPFSSPFSGPQNGDVFWILKKCPLMKPKNGTDFGYGK